MAPTSRSVTVRRPVWVHDCVDLGIAKGRAAIGGECPESVEVLARFGLFWMVFTFQFVRCSERWHGGSLLVRIQLVFSRLLSFQLGSLLEVRLYVFGRS